ncbi:multidrug efflux pump/multidrug efflux pump [Tistlia consotensis]|uniref:Multidrug efflux pump/multidrug efflux pump n=1 Tax=Tistlia consotensis USBA 355 TaxID=560819 RepID=A0A1Y6B8E1_9PROT|nr:multidrug efflux RND transporter permease subunit [Tistlia consotensis]SME89733.1 multidrug efflux pump/multidrug efflux pump [Tistlia consotensis USBA 355]SNR26255.1 multidrug efflux pump/multidrug efflux pump [Tistlia consotensis]
MGSFTDIFIRRPVLASVVSLLILLIGLQAVFSLQIREYPELSSTTITITTTYPGANADLIKGFITTPIEQAVASAEGIDTLTSTSQQNVSTVTLNLLLNANADRAVADVLSKVNQVQSVLPSEANDPIVKKQTGDSTALMYISFNSDVMTAPQITDYLTRVIQPKLQTVNGVADAQILGGQTFAMRIWLDPDKMAALQITPSDVADALARNNFTSAAGQIKGDFVQDSINAETSLDSAAAFSRLVVATRGDSLIRLRNIANIELGPESADSSSAFDGTKAVFIGVYTTPTANPLTVIQSIRDLMPEIQRQLPQGLSAAVAYDATAFINASIEEVERTLGEAAIIVVVVIFLFLGNFRSTLIPIVTIPLSLIGVMVMLQGLGFSINLLTLLALVLAIGLVVDDAIVVVENIYRHIEDGMKPFEAALRGAREIAMPVVSMTITLAAVYAPIGFVSGVTGALFREFAFTLAGAVFVSGIIALTLSPMMCSRLLRHEKGGGAFARFLDRRFEGLKNAYRSRLTKTLGFRLLTVTILIAIVAMTAMLYLTTPSELAPTEDQGILFSQVKTPESTNLDYLEHTTADLYDVFKTVPEKDHVFAINGLGDVHTAFSGILLKPWNERSRAANQVLQELQPKFATIPGGQVLAFQPPALPGSTGGTPVQFVITSTSDYKQIADVLQDLQQAAQKSGLFIFTDTDLRFNSPQVQFSIDHDKANRLGISMQDIGSALATFLGGNYVNRFDLYGRSYQVIPQVPREYRMTADWLTRYQVRTSNGDLVPLSTVATVSRTVQPNALSTFQQLNSATLSGVPYPGRTLGEALDFLRNYAEKNFPEGFTFDYGGQSRQLVKEGNTLALAFVFALIIIFLVLAAQFESFRDPIIILIALPTSMFGALLPVNILSLTGGSSINIYTQIGLVTLIGLISKHGILMVEFANKLQEEEGYGKMQAIEEAAAVRLRPILMTTAAMVVAMVPLLIASGAGARSRFDIGLVIASGMTIGTMFTLFVTPAIYSLVARDHTADRARQAGDLETGRDSGHGSGGHGPTGGGASGNPGGTEPSGGGAPTPAPAE